MAIGDKKENSEELSAVFNFLTIVVTCSTKKIKEKEGKLLLKRPPKQDLQVRTLDSSLNYPTQSAYCLQSLFIKYFSPQLPSHFFKAGDKKVCIFRFTLPVIISHMFCNLAFFLFDRYHSSLKTRGFT